MYGENLFIHSSLTLIAYREIDKARLVEGYCSRFCSSQIAGPWISR
jgi:hypothetical protein